MESKNQYITGKKAKPWLKQKIVDVANLQR
jgi:hypothetical protein